MDTFLKDVHYQIFYHWCKQKQFTGPVEEQTSNNFQRIIQLHPDYHIEITFWKQGVIEETIKSKETEEMYFYMHYEFINLLQASKLTASFTKHLATIDSTKKILIVCSCGISSSYFASNLEQYARDKHIKVSVEASGMQHLQPTLHQYDCVLLAPQVQHLAPKLLASTSRLLPIDTHIFATGNYVALLSLINT